MAAVIIVLFFRDSISKMVGRLSKLKAGTAGIELEAAEAIKQAGAKPTTPDVPSDTVASQVSSRKSAVVAKWEEWIRKDIAALNPQDDKSTIATLITQLAEAQLLVNAERVYRLIFGSQIAILKMLNTLGSKPIASLLEIYNAAATQWPQVYRTYSFAQ